MIEHGDVVVIDITDKMLRDASGILDSRGREPISLPIRLKQGQTLATARQDVMAVMSIGKAGMLDYIDGELQADDRRYDILLNDKKVSIKTFTNHWQPVPINHTAIFPSHNLENLIDAEIYIVVCVCLKDKKLNIVGVISKERLKEIAIPCDKGEMIGVGKKYPAVAEGLWIQYNQLDPFVLEEWNDKVATA